MAGARPTSGVRVGPPPEAAAALAEARRRVAGIDGWELEQWFEAITRMHGLSVQYDLRLHQPNPDIIVMPSGSVGQIGRPTVTMLEPRPAPSAGQMLPFIVYPGNPERRILDGVIVPRSALPAMLIDLSGSDEHIRSEVERVLRECKNSTTLLRTTGPTSLSMSLTNKRVSEKWRRNRIVEIVEMMAWNSEGSHDYSNSALCSWIDPDRLNSDKSTGRAVEVVRQALAALPAILAEVDKVKP